MLRLVIAPILVIGAAGPAPSLDWIGGHWCTGPGGESVEEFWLPAHGGVALGLSRTRTNGHTAAFEFLRIVDVDGTPTYFAQPGGRPPVVFRSTAGGDRWIRFENRDHDFPQRIEYRREGDRLHAEIAGPGEDGAERVIAFEYRRCREGRQSATEVPSRLPREQEIIADADATAEARKAGAALRIVLQNNSPAERQVLARLARLFVQHEALQRWLFTGGMVIDEATRIPHSHPVLTMNTRIEGDVDLLAVLVHEQLHWFANERGDAVEKAVSDFREIFPKVPAGGREGARDESSSYLHLVVCDLEFQALTELVGEERARKHLAAMTHYTWIYRQVLEDPRVREVNAHYGLLVP